MTTEHKTTIDLTSDQLFLYRKFQQHYELIAYFTAYLDAMGTDRILLSQVVLDVDKDGVISHCSITKHFKKTW